MLSDHQGIYMITCLATGRFYIGSAKNFRKRVWVHKSRLNHGKHHNAYLQAAWLRYGPSRFAFYLLEAVQDAATLIEREQHWMDAMQACQSGFNFAPRAGSTLGRVFSLESRQKMSAKKKGIPLSPEHRAALSKARKGRTVSEETRKRMSEWQKGRSPSATCRAAVAESNRRRSKSWAAENMPTETA